MGRKKKSELDKLIDTVFNEEPDNEEIDEEMFEDDEEPFEDDKEPFEDDEEPFEDDEEPFEENELYEDDGLYEDDELYEDDCEDEELMGSINNPFGSPFGVQYNPINNAMGRLWPMDVDDKEVTKALKKLKGMEEFKKEDIEQEYYILKEGNTLNKKEKDLLMRVNALRLVQGMKIVRITDKEEVPKIINKLKKKYKVYECAYTDSRLGSMMLKKKDFLEYIKKHKVSELFLSKEKSISISDFDNCGIDGYEALEEDVKTYKKLIKKLKHNITSCYMLSCFVDEFLIRTRIETKYANSVDLWNEVYGLHKNEVMNNKI